MLVPASVAFVASMHCTPWRCSTKSTKSVAFWAEVLQAQGNHQHVSALARHGRCHPTLAIELHVCMFTKALELRSAKGSVADPFSLSSSVKDVSIVFHRLRRWSLEWMTCGASRRVYAVQICVPCANRRSVLRFLLVFQFWDQNQVDGVIGWDSEASEMQFLHLWDNDRVVTSKTHCRVSSQTVHPWMYWCTQCMLHTHRALCSYFASSNIPLFSSNGHLE